MSAATLDVEKQLIVCVPPKDELRHGCPGSQEAEVREQEMHVTVLFQTGKKPLLVRRSLHTFSEKKTSGKK